MSQRLGGKSIEKDAGRLRVLISSAPAVTSTVDHGTLLGLSDDDHTQYVHGSSARTITAQHTFNPTGAPFLIGAAATGTLVSGLNADLLDGTHLAALVQTSRQVIAGSGLTGGGALSSDVTLNVGAGTLISVTTDAVSLAEGSAQYQVPVTGGTPFTPAWTALSGMAGAGLTFGTGAFAVGAGDGLTVGADAVGLTTPGTLSVSSTNVATGSHTHAITASAAPGAAAALLKSNTSGGLDLTGDFSVGSTKLFVDVSQSGVGINMAPDAQFALDVTGSTRTSGYFVGKHAIQIPDALAIMHYDGGQPYTTDYNGDLRTHQGVAPTVQTGGYCFRPGKFGKALQVGSAGSNLCPNPSFETDLTGWGPSAGTTITRSTDYSRYGSAACKSVSTTGTPYVLNASVSFVSGTYYTLVLHARKSDGGVITTSDIPNLYCEGVGVNVRSIQADTDGWYRVISDARQAAATGTNFIGWYQANSLTLYIDGVIVTPTAYPVPYFDGSMDVDPAASQGHYWDGTAHLSTSVRTTPTVQYAPFGVSWDVGSVMAWIYYDGIHKIDSPWIISLWGDTNNYIIMLYATTSNQPYVTCVTGGASGGATGQEPFVTGWNHIAATWLTGGQIKYYLNGVLVGTPATYTKPAVAMASIGIGSSGSINTLLEELCFVNREMPASEIRAVYESNAPVFAETSIQGFTIPNQVVWADSEGLWIRTMAGEYVFGAYAGETTKAWGGFTLSPGDIAIGSYGSGAGGWQQWDLSVATLKIGYGTATVFDLESTGATITGNLTIATGGTIYAGSDAWLNSSGLSFDYTLGTDAAAVKWYNGASVFASIIGKDISGARGMLFVAEQYHFFTGSDNSLEIESGAVRSKKELFASTSVDFQTTATPTAGDANHVKAYLKSSKFILQYDDGGTVRYKYLDLTGTGVTWVHTTTAP